MAFPVAQQQQHVNFSTYSLNKLLREMREFVFSYGEEYVDAVLIWRDDRWNGRVHFRPIEKEEVDELFSV